MGRHARCIVATHPENVRYEVRRIRQRVLGVTVLLALALSVIVGLTTWMYDSDVDRQDRLNELVGTQPRIVATVETVRDTNDDELGSETAVVVVGGKSVAINNPGEFSWTEVFRAMFSEFRYEMGDRVTIVIDPNDESRAWDVRDRLDLSPWAHIAFVLFIWGAVSAFVKFFMWRMDWTFPFKIRAVPHLLWRPRTATVRVAELRPGKWWDDLTVATSCATLVVELDGNFHVWDVHTYGSADIEEGLEFTVWGRPRPGGWVIGLTTPHTIYPRSRLD